VFRGLQLLIERYVQHLLEAVPCYLLIPTALLQSAFTQHLLEAIPCYLLIPTALLQTSFTPIYLFII
jgi:hypothetical protein